LNKHTYLDVKALRKAECVNDEGIRITYDAIQKMQKNLNHFERRGTKANLKKNISMLKKPTITTPNSFSPKSTMHSSEREAFVYGIPQLKPKENKAGA
tara:strand:+ start:74 stop:367 length:294 start_codon:yes stop_codon:yes gene_type:complete